MHLRRRKIGTASSRRCIAKKFDAIVAVDVDHRRSARKRSTSPTSITTRRRPSSSRRTLPITEATEDALDGKTLGRPVGDDPLQLCRSAHARQSELKLYPTAEEYKLDIVNGRIDAVIDDVVVLSEWLKTDDGACCKLLGTLPIDPVINGEGAGIAVRKGDDALREQVQRRDRRDPRERQVQGNQRKVLPLRRLRQLSGRTAAEHPICGKRIAP